mmetsp:Transcript_23819/g.64093  ORF Transcript_23819/g.64093 Transcript_23819/m.64093 type:complete len:212 (-) Transcript_23819:185-820(-)
MVRSTTRSSRSASATLAASLRKVASGSASSLCTTRRPSSAPPSAAGAASDLPSASATSLSRPLRPFDSRAAVDLSSSTRARCCSPPQLRSLVICCSRSTRLERRLRSRPPATNKRRLPPRSVSVATNLTACTSASERRWVPQQVLTSRPSMVTSRIGPVALRLRVRSPGMEARSSGATSAADTGADRRISSATMASIWPSASGPAGLSKST